MVDGAVFVCGDAEDDFADAALDDGDAGEDDRGGFFVFEDGGVGLGGGFCDGDKAGEGADAVADVVEFGEAEK